MPAKTDFPLIYSCSGCSSAAQTANYMALKIDREGLAEMSCIAGVGGNVLPLVRLAQSGRPIIALDGCALACVKNSLAQRGVTPARHYDLGKLGIKKRPHMDFDRTQADALLQTVREGIAELQTANETSS